MVGHAFDEAGLEVFLPEALNADRWAAFDQDAIDTEVATKERDIEMLRCADFADLVTTEFLLTLRDGEAASKNLTRLNNPPRPPPNRRPNLNRRPRPQPSRCRAS